MRHFEWLVAGALASALIYSASTSIHIVIIFATHGRHPPILDLAALAIALVSYVSVSMFPAVVVFSLTLRRNRARWVVVACWFLVMVATGILALVLVLDTYDPVANAVPDVGNAERACYLPDGKLLTSPAQLGGSKHPDCVYNCFLNYGSVLKDQDAATVVRGPSLSDTIGGVSLAIYITWICIMTVFGEILTAMRRRKGFLDRWADASAFQQSILGSGLAVLRPNGYDIITVCISLGLVMWMPAMIMIEYSMRDIPVEEKSNSVGQWGPWVAACFAITGALIYWVVKRREKSPAAHGETDSNSISILQRLRV